MIKAKPLTDTNDNHCRRQQQQQLKESPRCFLEANQLTVHIEWLDSLLLFSHLYNNYDALATIQRHQFR